jgi:cytidine deaminase
MKRRELRISVCEYDAVVELPEADQKLLLRAREASKKAYAPYSKFHVGAAVELENGETITGSNQENVDFTDGLCAERVALFYANSTFPESSIKSIAISARNEKGLVDETVQPCGSCRQVMVETEARYKKRMRIILDGKKKIMVLEGASNLLPFAFNPSALDD